jgi:hypothetical protein
MDDSSIPNTATSMGNLGQVNGDVCNVQRLSNLTADTNKETYLKF